MLQGSGFGSQLHFRLLSYAVTKPGTQLVYKSVSQLEIFNAMSPLKLYFDFVSQPSRAVYIFLKINKIPFEEKRIRIENGEHRTAEYAKVNPFQLLPAIDDGGFKLRECTAILAYLSRSRQVRDHWYPTDPKIRARVDEYLSWQRLNVGLNAVMVFKTQFVDPVVTQQPIDFMKAERFSARLQTNLRQLEDVFLKDRDYLTSDDISIADLMGVCELMQPYAVNMDVREGHPVLAAWIERVKTRLEPHFEEAHQYLYSVRRKFMTEMNIHSKI